MNKHQRGVLIFIAISIASLFLIFYLDETDFSKLIISLGSFDLRFIPLALVFLLLHLLADGFRIKILGWAVETNLTLYTGIRAGLANEFLSAFTPFQSGGQPFEVYTLHASGIPLGKCALMSYFRTITSLVFLATSGILSLILFPEIFLVPKLVPLYIYGGGYITLIATLTLLMVFKPRVAKLITYTAIKILKKIRVMKKEGYYENLKYLLGEVNTFNHHIKDVFIRKKGYMLFAVFVTFCTWIFKFVVGYFIALGFHHYITKLKFNPDIPAFKIVLFQSAVFFINHAIPTPGASGTTEFSANGIFPYINMAFQNSPDLVNTFVTLWRFFTYHIIIIVAWIVSSKSIKTFLKLEKKKELEKA